MPLRRTLLAAILPLASLGATAAAADAPVFALSPLPRDAALSPMADSAPMRVILSLPLRNEASARAYADAVSTPDNPLYGHYLTPAQFGDRYGADPAAYEALRAWAAAAGLQVGPRLDSRAEISLGGTAGQFAALFGTHFAHFATSRGDAYTVTHAPRLPAALAGRVDAVIGLTSPGKLALLYRRAQPRADVGHGVNGSGYDPADLAQAYDVPAQAGVNTETAAIFEQDGYKPSDLRTYETAYGLPAVPNQAISINGSTTGTVGNGGELEADLDLDMLVAANPKLAKLLVYIDSQDTFQTALLDFINQAAQANTAQIVSISYGQDEVMQGTPAIRAENKALLQFKTEGITVFASAGDQGAAGRSGSGLNAPDPGSQPLLTSVGGTALATTSTGAYAGETVWNDLNTTGDGATGSGVSSIWSIPKYQLVNGISVAAANGGSSTHRNVPDIAAVADPDNSPVSVYSADYGGWVGLGGTSVSAPVWAGWVSIFNGDRVAAGKVRLGALNPRLYRLGEQKTHFHDVVSGNNGSPGFRAGPGYDNTTGFGSVDVAKALASFTR